LERVRKQHSKKRTKKSRETVNITKKERQQRRWMLRDEEDRETYNINGEES
jgi:hypothetical protein